MIQPTTDAGPRPLAEMQKRRVAIVHDYLVHVRGGERVLIELSRMLPHADIYTLIFDPRGMGNPGKVLATRGVHSSFLRHLPRPGKLFRAYLPLYPLAASLLDVSKYDVVITSSSAWSHGVRVNPSATHICYCHTPFRYAWSHYDELVSARRYARLLLTPVLRSIRAWDLRASQRVGTYVANSQTTRKRIRQYYNRESVVVPPPVDTQRFSASTESGKYFLVVSALVPYKRVDLTVQAFNRLGLPLVIVGSGPARAKLERIAAPNVQFVGSISDLELAEYYRNCRALVFPTNEDFGIVPVEAMASGRPVIAYAEGGALETVVPGVTGDLFSEQTPEAIVTAIEGFRAERFDPETIRRHASEFATTAFQARFRHVLESCLATS